MQACSRTGRKKLGLAAAVLALAGCASQPAPTSATTKPYDFGVETKILDGDVVRISVKPNGGNARIRIDRETDQILTWTSDTEFLIRFEPLDSDRGGGGDDLGAPRDWTSATRSTGTGSYQFSLRLDPDRPGRGVYTTKYHVKRRASDAYELDPVVIVDR